MVKKRIGILTGGGDCCGLNQTIRGAVYRAKDFDYETFGIYYGWKGLVEGMVSHITLTDVEKLMDKAGTCLGSSRTNPYKINDGVKKSFKNY